jgi:hypothetical protein
MIKLDDNNILQHDNLVGSNSSPECMTRSALKTQYLKAPTVQESGSWATRPTNTYPGLIQVNPDYPKGLGNPHTPSRSRF